MLRRVAVLCLIIVLCLVAAEAQNKRVAMMNFDCAAVTNRNRANISSAQPARTAPSPSRGVTAASLSAPALPQPPQRTQSAVEHPTAQQPVQQPPARPAQDAPPGQGCTDMQTAREQTLQRSQAGAGFNLRSRFAEPASRMDGYIKGASDDLEDGGLESAKGFLEKAGRRVETPEKALNR